MPSRDSHDINRLNDFARSTPQREAEARRAAALRRRTVLTALGVAPVSAALGAVGVLKGPDLWHHLRDDKRTVELGSVDGVSFAIARTYQGGFKAVADAPGIRVRNLRLVRIATDGTVSVLSEAKDPHKVPFDASGTLTLGVIANIEGSSVQGDRSSPYALTVTGRDASQVQALETNPWAFDFTNSAGSLVTPPQGVTLD